MTFSMNRWVMSLGFLFLSVQVALAQGGGFPYAGGLAANHQIVPSSQLPTEAPPLPPGVMPQGIDPYSAGAIEAPSIPEQGYAGGYSEGYSGGMGGEWMGGGSCSDCGVSCTSGICDSCGGGGWFGGAGMGGRNRFHAFGSIEYLMMWTDGQYYPVLATTSPAGTTRFINNNPNRPNAGVLGQAGIPLFGGDEINTDQKNGGRVTFGIFLDPECNVSWVNRFSVLSTGTNRFNAASQQGMPTLARPFVDVFTINPRGENALLLGFNDPVNGLVTNGRINIEADSNVMVADTYIKTMLHNSGDIQFDVLAGFQYTRVDNDLDIQSVHTFFPIGPVTFNLHDQIQAKNDFYGGVIGFQMEKRYGRFSINALAKTSLGTTHQEVRLHGAQTASTALGSQAVPGGFYVQRSNAGNDLEETFSRNVFSVVPEVNVTLGYWITPHVQATLGYTGVYWTNQVQAGDIIDTRINFAQQTVANAGPALPRFQWRDGDFWMQGMHAGLNIDY